MAGAGGGTAGMAGPHLLLGSHPWASWGVVDGVDAQLTGGGTEWLAEVHIEQPLVAEQGAELPEG